MGKPIVMGRKTYESIGRPLPGRQNIVITRQDEYAAPGCDVVPSPDEAVRVAGEADEIMVIGGGHIYRDFLPAADRIYLTHVHADIAGDTFLPDLEESEWQETSCLEQIADADNDYDVTFRILERI